MAQYWYKKFTKVSNCVWIVWKWGSIEKKQIKKKKNLMATIVILWEGKLNAIKSTNWEISNVFKYILTEIYDVLSTGIYKLEYIRKASSSGTFI